MQPSELSISNDGICVSRECCFQSMLSLNTLIFITYEESATLYRLNSSSKFSTTTMASFWSAYTIAFCWRIGWFTLDLVDSLLNFHSFGRVSPYSSSITKQLSYSCWENVENTLLRKASVYDMNLFYAILDLQKLFVSS